MNTFYNLSMYSIFFHIFYAEYFSSFLYLNSSFFFFFFFWLLEIIISLSAIGNSERNKGSCGIDLQKKTSVLHTLIVINIFSMGRNNNVSYKPARLGKRHCSIIIT